MKLLLLIFIFPFAIIAQEINTDSLLFDLSNTTSPFDAMLLQAKYSGIYCFSGYAVADSDMTKSTKRALRSKRTGLFKDISNEDNTTSHIMVFENSSDYMMRMSYIALGPGDNKAKEADSLCNLINNGVSFEEVAQKYTMALMDADDHKNGDFGWLKRGQVDSAIEASLLTHKLGDVFAAESSDYGWYVIKLTEKPKKRRYISYIEVRI